VTRSQKLDNLPARKLDYLPVRKLDDLQPEAKASLYIYIYIDMYNRTCMGSLVGEPPNQLILFPSCSWPGN